MEPTMPSNKDILRDLRSNTDDALEDFVKAQMTLFAKMDIIKDFDAKIAAKENSYSDMTRGKSYEFLKTYEPEIDLLDAEIQRLKAFKSYHEKDASKLEMKCLETETALSNARKVEREFLDKNF